MSKKVCPDCAGSGTKIVCHGILPEHGNIAQEQCPCELRTDWRAYYWRYIGRYFDRLQGWIRGRLGGLPF